MYKIMLEKGVEKKVTIPAELCKKCGFSPPQEVIIEEGNKVLVIREPVESKTCPKTIDELFALPAGALANRALGGEGSGDFDEQDID